LYFQIFFKYLIFLKKFCETKKSFIFEKIFLAYQKQNNMLNMNRSKGILFVFLAFFLAGCGK